MNINTEIDEVLIKEATERSGLSVEAALEEGLRALIKRHVARDLTNLFGTVPLLEAEPVRRQRRPNGGRKPEKRPDKTSVNRTYELDRYLVEEAIDASGLPDGRTAIEEALRVFTRLCAQEALADMFGKIPIGDDYESMREE